jgi:hypothetical protein
MRYGGWRTNRWSALREVNFLKIVFFIALGLLTSSAGATVVQPSDAEFDHLATGFPLTGQHEVIKCEACHVDAVFKGLPTGCSGCHDAAFTVGKAATHIPTTAECDICHTTIGFSLSAIMDHSTIEQSCVSCHDGGTASGKAINHMPTTDNCQACHITSTWSPAFTVDHNEVLGSCSGCHDGKISLGKPAFHIVSSGNCGACHDTNAFSPAVTVDHNEVPETCATAGCHKQPAMHTTATSACEKCHSSIAWIPVK